MKKIIPLLLFSILLGCSKSNQEPPPVGMGNCNSGYFHEKIGFRENIIGIVLDSTIECSGDQFVIRPIGGTDNLRLLGLCTIPEEFQKDSLKVIFSGYDYKTVGLLDICAFPFEITKIRKYEP